MVRHGPPLSVLEAIISLLLSFLNQHSLNHDLKRVLGTHVTIEV